VCVSGDAAQLVTLSSCPAAIPRSSGHDIGVSMNVYTQSPVESKLKVVSAVEKLIFGSWRSSGVLDIAGFAGCY
jgi:hypothetical protein